MGEEELIKRHVCRYQPIQYYVHNMDFFLNGFLSCFLSPSLLASPLIFGRPSVCSIHLTFFLYCAKIYTVPYIHFTNSSDEFEIGQDSDKN